MFAEALPNPYNFASIGWVVVILTCIIWGVRQALGLARDVKGKPTPGDVQYESVAKFATKEELAALSLNNDGVHKDIFSKIGGVERGANASTEKKLEELRHERREDMRVLHAEINEVGKKVAGLEKETELQNQSMARMDSKLDRLIERKA